MSEPSSPFLILIIDDDLLIQMQLRIFLQKEGYKIILASNGSEGIEAYLQHRPDLVLLDALMPVMDGFDCCAKLVAQPGSEHTPILMITGLDDQDSVDRAFEAGATDYITKPIHWAVLRQRVRRLLKQVQLQKDLQKANRILKSLVSLDGLTQIYNRRRFDEYFNLQWRQLTRDKSPLSLILCDVDFFKSYNDTYGHAAGDECLKKVAQAIKVVFKRSTDLVARYGGEEFAVILPKTKAEDAAALAEKTRLSVKNLQLPHVGSTYKYVSISLGVASVIPEPNTDPKTLFKAADDALYQSKSQGRDRFSLANTVNLML